MRKPTQRHWKFNLVDSVCQVELQTTERLPVLDLQFCKGCGRGEWNRLRSAEVKISAAGVHNQSLFFPISSGRQRCRHHTQDEVRGRERQTSRRRSMRGALDTTKIDSSQENIEHRSVICGGLFRELRSETLQAPRGRPKREPRRHPAAACHKFAAGVSNAQRSVQGPLHGQAVQGKRLTIAQKRVGAHCGVGTG